jgi:hypothetical protein
MGEHFRNSQSDYDHCAPLANTQSARQERLDLAIREHMAPLFIEFMLTCSQSAQFDHGFDRVQKRMPSQHRLRWGHVNGSMTMVHTSDGWTKSEKFHCGCMEIWVLI